MVRVEEGNREFTRMSKSSSIFRHSYALALCGCCDTSVHSRLVKRMRDVIYSDRISRRGDRNPTNGDNRLLKGFKWNEKKELKEVMLAKYIVEVNREDGVVSVNIPSYIPQEVMAVNPEASHYRIGIAVGEVNWNEDPHFDVCDRFSNWIPCDSERTEEINAVIEIGKESSCPIVTCICVLWAKECNGNMYRLRNMDYNTAEVVDVDVVGMKNEKLKMKKEEKVLNYEL